MTNEEKLNEIKKITDDVDGFEDNGNYEYMYYVARSYSIQLGKIEKIIKQECDNNTLNSCTNPL
ncbi:hypothetical protein [Methylotenera sp.]|uniref:hypothetical protein n=1 Tax=Methylotenera sp. TaxID=2051956 RepID=UPI0027301F6F|nr:hypothetical protein [Methylotenera sp.]MDP2230833.1 hypothetical protein [Methylotenera sp.]MDP3141239.1 hypothetical protein [Methylotenera sp.]